MRIWNKFNWIDALNQRWSVVPFGQDKRASTMELMKLSDKNLAEIYLAVLEKDTIDDFNHRGWFHLLYKDFLKDKRILDIGTGLGISSIQFLKWGNEVIFADIVKSNLDLVKRLTEIFGITENAKFLHISSLSDLRQLSQIDVLFAGGSLHHAPKDFLEEEYDILQESIVAGGRWLQLAYPNTRWIREGSPAFEKWGEDTDGPGTPFAMPIDAKFVQEMIHPRRSRVVLEHEFHNHDFVWIDLELL